jgi:hypothetical protein
LGSLGLAISSRTARAVPEARRGPSAAIHATDMLLTHNVCRIATGLGVPARPAWERCRRCPPKPGAAPSRAPHPRHLTPLEAEHLGKRAKPEPKRELGRQQSDLMAGGAINLDELALLEILDPGHAQREHSGLRSWNALRMLVGLDKGDWPRTTVPLVPHPHGLFDGSRCGFFCCLASLGGFLAIIARRQGWRVLGFIHEPQDSRGAADRGLSGLWAKETLRRTPS